jgi:Tfp pilus assembly protein PilW
MPSFQAQSDQSGYSMIELIIAAAMMLVVLGAVVSLLLSSMRAQPEITDRAHQIGEARNALEDLTVDIRQGFSATYVDDPTRISLETICDEAPTTRCTVEYDCNLPEAGGTFGCTRTVDSTEEILVTGLASSNVFCVTPSTGDPESEAPKDSDCWEESNGEPPTYVGVKIEFPAGEQDGNTVLEGGAALHNLEADES